MSHRLDEWDRQIVSVLQREGRSSNVEIARQLGLAEATVRKRIDQLLESGAVSVVAVADPERLGLTSRMMIAVQTEQAQLQAIAERLAAFPEVCSVSIVTGTYDIIIEVVLASTGQLLSFILDKVVAIPGVKRTDTYHVLKVVKRFCNWAIPDESLAARGHAPQRSPHPQAGVVPGAIVISS
jgi:Lrp/AsnC family transcriptional regulator, regulator for asnA, asnC and gidA